ncbi:hypothetical protein GF373_03270 [bacterium]|nr:hypothetical protein [bacterium]
MKNQTQTWLISLCIFLSANWPLCNELSNFPENIALQAKSIADSEYSSSYASHYLTDQKIPHALRENDTKQAWCVAGKTHRHNATLRFNWEHPQNIAEIIYYGRTAWNLDECWKDFEIRMGDNNTIQHGQFEMRHGPQQIRIEPPVKTTNVSIHFTSSYGGLNPGASEIEIYSQPLSKSELQQLSQKTRIENKYQKTANFNRLTTLIERLKLRANNDSESLNKLNNISKSLSRYHSLPAEDLLELQRNILLYDIDKILVIKRHEILASHVYTYHYEGFSPGGGLYIFNAKRPESPPQELVKTTTGQILDCDLSHDSQKILFSWRKSQDEAYHVWTINTDGSNLTQITDGPWHDYNACWLPEGGIAFLSTRSPQFAYCWHAPVGVVYKMNADGSNVRQLSANYLNDFTPYVLNDGRIIYSRWEYVDKPAIPIQSLWTMRPDGTNLSMYFGNGVLSPGTFMEAKPIPNSRNIVCTMTGHNGPTRGAIGVIDRSKGINSQEAIVNITPDVHIPPVDQGNGNTPEPKPYSGPWPLDSERLLLAAQGPILVRTFSDDCQSVAIPNAMDGMQYFNPIPIRVRPRPPVIPAQSKNEDPVDQSAFVYLQDVYQGLEPYVKKGEIKRIRVIRELPKTVRIDPEKRAFGFQFPVISCGATYAGKTVLGEVDIEPDGSAYFAVPANVPIYFMVLDKAGRALQRMRSFTHLMPGETQGCVGCHEPRNMTPLLASKSALQRLPKQLQKPDWGATGFDYTKHVQPVWDQYCITCHNYAQAPKGIDLTGGKTDFFNVSYEILARQDQGRSGSPYVNWIPTYNGHEQNILKTKPLTWGSPQSHLADIILSGHKDRNGNKRFQMESKSIRRVLAWIDLNVPYYGTSETAYPNSVGCRQIYPAALDEVLLDVAKRRCFSCHTNKTIPRKEWTRISFPERNSFLSAPLAKAAGGRELCGKAIFLTDNDPDYQAILATFDSISQMMAQRPRLDMPGGTPNSEVNRSCK